MSTAELSGSAEPPKPARIDHDPAWLRYPGVTPLLVGGLIAVGTLIRLPQLSRSLHDAYQFRQTQTAFVVREYAQHGIDLFSTPLPVFGVRSDVPFEFPLFQATASVFVDLGLSVEQASRLVGLVSFQVSAILLAVLLVRWHGRLEAVLAILLFQLSPFGIHWGGAALIDFFAVALALAMVVGIDRWFSSASVLWLIGGSVAAVLALLVKVTTAPAWVALLMVSAIVTIRRETLRPSWRRLLAGFAAGPGLGVVLTVWWTRYADSVKESNELTRFLVSSRLSEWSFGSISQRTDLDKWQVVYERVGQQMAGPLLVGLMLAVGACIWLPDVDRRLATLGWLIVLLGAPLLFFNLYVVHNYYLIAVYPAVVAAVCVGLVWAARLVPARPEVHALMATAATTVLLWYVLTSPLGDAELKRFRSARPADTPATILSNQTRPGDRIVMIGCSWNPSYLYFAEREGLMFPGEDSGTVWEHEDIDDYRYLFSCKPVLKPDRFLPDGYRAAVRKPPYLFTIMKVR